MNASFNNPNAMPDIISLLLQSSNLNAKATGGQPRKNLDPQKVKTDIVRALNDPTFSKDLVSLADEIIEKKRLKALNSAGGPDGRNLVRLNAKAMGLWKEYEREKTK